MDAVTHVPRRTRDEAIDELFDVLADRGRRTVVAELVRDGPTDLESLAERLADESDSLSTRDATIRLVHNHLPQLESAGLVDYDHAERRCEIARSDTAASVCRVLHAARSCV